jgi:hypothetical protein
VRLARLSLRPRQFFLGSADHEQTHKACVIPVSRVDRLCAAAPGVFRDGGGDRGAAQCPGKGKCRVARARQSPRSVQSNEANAPSIGRGTQSGAGRKTTTALCRGHGAHAGARPWISSPRFEVSGSLLFLQAGASNLEYGTLVTPLPLATPNWSNQSLAPKFKPAFRIGARYMPNESNDIELNWTHHDSTTNDSFLASPTQMVGPPYLIGPESALYKVGSGSVQSRYDAVNLDGGHTFCVECNFQFRVFGGVEVARIGQNLSGLFQSPDGLASSGYTTTSLFTGAGPRLGINGQYAFGDFQMIGELAGAGLIGSSQSQINFSTVSPALGLNNQSLTSPNAIQLVPSIDAKLAAAYNFAPRHLRTVQSRGGVSRGGLFQRGRSVCNDSSTDKSRAATRGSLPGDGAASSKKLHGTRSVFYGRLAVLGRGLIS